MTRAMSRAVRPAHLFFMLAPWPRNPMASDSAARSNSRPPEVRFTPLSEITAAFPILGHDSHVMIGMFDCQSHNYNAVRQVLGVQNSRGILDC